MPEYQVVDIRPPTPEEDRLAAWLAEQELRSPERLEAAARQVVGLVTGLVGLLLGVVVVTEPPLPAYLSQPLVRGLAVAGIVFLLLALLAGMGVLWPRRGAMAAHDPAAQREAFQALLRHKARWLGVALAYFSLGVVVLAAVLVLAVGWG